MFPFSRSQMPPVHPPPQPGAQCHAINSRRLRAVAPLHFGQQRRCRKQYHRCRQRLKCISIIRMTASWKMTRGLPKVDFEAGEGRQTKVHPMVCVALKTGSGCRMENKWNAQFVCLIWTDENEATSTTTITTTAAAAAIEDAIIKTTHTHTYTHKNVHCKKFDFCYRNHRCHTCTHILIAPIKLSPQFS